MQPETCGCSLGLPIGHLEPHQHQTPPESTPSVALAIDTDLGTARTIHDDTLWCVNVLGPDDVHACRDRADAIRFALWLNLSFLRLFDHPRPLLPALQAVAVEWPHSRESHAEDLVRRDREEPRWAANWREALRGLADEVLSAGPLDAE